MSTRLPSPGPSVPKKRPVPDQSTGLSDTEGRFVKKAKLGTKKRPKRRKQRKSPIVGAGSGAPVPELPPSSKAPNSLENENPASQPPLEETTPPIEIENLNAELASKSSLLTKQQDAISQIQQNLTCQICLDLLYKPFALSPCGHVACYSCLLSWFSRPVEAPGDRQPPIFARKKSCPHCRATISEPPVEVWTIKEMVNTLSRTGLFVGLPPTAVEPNADVPKEELWKNIFRLDISSDDGREHLGIRDDEDGGVYRCIDCLHEIHGAVCTHCNRVYYGHHLDDPDFSDEGEALFPLFELLGEEMSEGEEDLDDDDEDDGYHLPYDLLPYAVDPIFIDDGENDDDDDDDGGRIVEVNSDGEEDEEDGDEPDLSGSRRALYRRGPDEVIEVTDDDDDDEYHSVVPYRPSRRLRRAQMQMLSDEEDEEDEEEDDDDTVVPRRPSGGLRGAQMAINLLSDEEDEDDYHGDGYRSALGRRRR